MSMLLPPQMLNTILPTNATWPTSSIKTDPVRRYMLPVHSDRRADWPSHPMASGIHCTSTTCGWPKA